MDTTWEGQPDCHALILEHGPQDDVRLAVDWLAARSCETVLLRPGLNVPYCDLPGVPGLERWPAWPARPWIVAGRVAPRKAPAVYDGPFVQKARDEDYEAQVTRLLAAFDWAAFSYFTTYHDDLVSIITCDPVLARDITRRFAPLGSSHGSPTALRAFQNATFFDYGREGLFAWQLARKRGEPPPLLLTSIMAGQSAFYHRHDEETGGCEGRVWFASAMQRLECVMDITIASPYGDAAHYCLHRATELDAYLELWSMASHEKGIAQATLSADCDLGALENCLRQCDWLDIIRDSEDIASWAYGQIYGGGADEHHAVFHSRDARATQRIWEMAGASGISRF